MGTTFTKYNPTTLYGQFNLKNDGYTYKNKILLVLGTLLLIVIGVMVLVWTSDNLNRNNQFSPYNFPPPQYGNGPYGYGTYLPNKNILAETISYT